ncbi:PIG-L deacetylase family protein [Streptomyces sp. NPDC058486]|uniref:PIG-L deacetylase family protein n=1 Tax=unclassified Streptomyces TaxID=2593676 RepID=UPI00364CABB3
MTGPRLTSLVADGLPVTVLSPHLDDAVLSCGAFLSYAADRVPVTVVTAFTEAGPPPHTLSGLRYLHSTGDLNAARLYAARRAEDREALERLGARWHHLGLVDGLFRRRPRRPRGTAAGRGGRGGRIHTYRHVYPTYRFHLSANRLSRYDSGVLAGVIEAVARDAPGDRTLLLAPMAVGGHVDHLLVRTAAELSHRWVAYYSDFPYNESHRADGAFLLRSGLESTVWDRGLAGKTGLIRSYRTQVDGLFPGGRVPLRPEVYLLPRGGP